MTTKSLSPASICRYGNCLILLFISIYFFFMPFILLMFYLNDPGLKGQGIPRFAFRIHRNLAPRYERWARQRITSDKAKGLGLDQIAATEWPMFGSAFYLWATESLQQAWEKDKSLSSEAPNVYAAGSIEAAAALIADPEQAAWVKKHWGENYLHKENAFYRMLLIGGLTSYHKLLGGDKYLGLIRDQVETLSKEIDKSRYGLLDDYPSQCYPTDVVASIAAIKRADPLLGTDHSQFIKRSIRAFEGNLLDSTGLPPYFASATSGNIDIARGCSNQWGTTWAAELWPDTAKKWYDNFEKYYWQKHWGAVGFREFQKNTDENRDWHLDVDSGPVVAGFGISASSFGMGTARANNRFDHAYPLGAEVLAGSWPLPDGTLLTARFLSNAAHARYVGEACLIFSFSRMPQGKPLISEGGHFPPIVYVLLALYPLAGIVVILATVLSLRQWHKSASKQLFRFQRIQLVLWVFLLIAGIVITIRIDLLWGLLPVLAAQLLPRFVKPIARVPGNAVRDTSQGSV